MLRRECKFIFYLFMGMFIVVLEAEAVSIIDSKQANAQVVVGELTLIDVRSPEEWRETGIPRGATALTIHNRNGIEGFVAAVTQLMDGKKDRPIALICARGWRSFRAANALLKAQFTKIWNLREGMLGNPLDGPGWIRRNLPVEHCNHC